MIQKKIRLWKQKQRKLKVLFFQKNKGFVLSNQNDSQGHQNCLIFSSKIPETFHIFVPSYCWLKF